MRLFRWLRIVGLILALSTVTPMVPISTGAQAGSYNPPPRRTGDPDLPEWTNQPVGPRPASTDVALREKPSLYVLMYRLFRGGRFAD